MNRYNRHIILSEIGQAGQDKISNAKVLVIGAGGLGCPVLQYLTAAGIGTLGVIDFDVVELSNLQRQVLFGKSSIGKNKAIVAKARLEDLNDDVKIVSYPEQLTHQNAINLFNQYDIIVDGSDNFETRYLVNDACIITNKPLVFGAIYKFEGQVSVFNYKEGPTYRCLFPEPPKAGSVPNCSDVGVLGVLPGLIGTQQANEVIKIILDLGVPLSGKLLTYDALNNSFLTLNVNRSEEEIQKVLNNSADFENIDYDFFCGIDSAKNLQEISKESLKSLLDSDEDFQIVDVRQEYEQPRIDLSTTVNGQLLVAPLNDLEKYIDQISKSKKVVVVCQHGIRSVAAIEHLKNKYDFKNLINLENGIAS